MSIETYNKLITMRISDLFISGNLKRYNIYRHNKKYYFEM